MVMNERISSNSLEEEGDFSTKNLKSLEEKYNKDEGKRGNDLEK